MEAMEVPVSLGGYCHYMSSPLPACCSVWVVRLSRAPWAIIGPLSLYLLPLEKQGTTSLHSGVGGRY